MLVPPVGFRPSEVFPPRQPPTPLDAGIPHVLSSRHCGILVRSTCINVGTSTDDTLAPTTAYERRNARAQPSGNDPKFMVQKHPSLRIRRPRLNTEALSRDRRQPSNQQRRSAPFSLARTLLRRLNPEVLSAPTGSNLRPAQPERCKQRQVQQTEAAYK